LNIDLSEPLGFEDLYREIIHPLEDFLTLATGESNKVLDLRVFIENSGKDENSGREMVQILYRQFHKQEKPGKRLDLHDMLFACTQIPEVGLSEVMTRWFNTYSELRSALGAFFSIYYVSSMFAEEKFKNVVNALESYHRKKMRREAIPGDEWKSLVNEILRLARSEHRSFLRMKLQYGNEQILADRLRSIMDLTDQASMRIGDNNEWFIRSVVDTRNYFTHYDETLKERALDGFKLVVATRILSHMMKILLMLEIGFTPDDCISLLSNNIDYMRYIRFAREYFARASVRV
jgi:hypothetical protein